jgi:hypothetical protein
MRGDILFREMVLGCGQAPISYTIAVWRDRWFDVLGCGQAPISYTTLARNRLKTGENLEIQAD